MLYLANPSTAAIRAAMRQGKLGCIVTPRQGNRLVPGALWAADNGCGPRGGGGPGGGFRGYERDLGWLQELRDAEAAGAADPDASDA